MTKEEFAKVLTEGYIIAQHSGGDDLREWHDYEEGCGIWLRPGEFVIKHNGCPYHAAFPLAMT